MLRVWFLGIFLALSSAPAWAQTLTASIAGTVVDESGAALPGVTVTLTSPALQIPQVVKLTDAQGGYQFAELPAGTYSVRLELAGFTALVREDIRLTTGFAARIDAEMKVGALQETVTVSGDSPIVDLTNTRGGAVLSNELIQSVPISTNYSDIRNLTPGMVENGRPQFGAISVGGEFKSYGVTGEERTFVEGLDMRVNDVPNFATVEEVSATTFGNTAEHISSGAAFNLVVKSGGNDFRGRLSEEYMNRRVQATNVDSKLQAQGIQAGDGLVSFQDAYGDLGGRIIRDSLWFYGAARDQRSKRTVTGFTQSPGADGKYGTGDDEPGQTPINYWNLTGKVSYQATSKHKLIGFVGRNLRDEIAHTASRLVPFESTQDWRFLLAQTKAEWQGALSNRVFATAIFGTTGSDSNYISDRGRTGLSTFDRSTQWATGETWNIYNRDVIWLRRKQLNSSLSYFPDRFLGGSHELKVGANMWWNTRPRRLNLRPGVDGGPPGNYRVIFDAGVPAELQARSNPVTVDSGSTVFGAYITDTWRVTKRLTVNIGIRADRNTAFVPETTKPAGPFDLPGTLAEYPRVDVGSWVAWGPRVGGAFALDSSGKTVVKSTWGRYTYIIPEWFAEPFSHASQVNTVYRWTDPNKNGRYDLGEVNLDPNGPDFLSVTGGRARKPNKFDLPHSNEVTASLERELFSSLSARVLYVFKKQSDEYDSVNVARPFNVYNVLINQRDPGPNGRVGDSDDGEMVTLYDYDPAFRGATFVSEEYRNRDASHDNHVNNLELTLSKRATGRWSGQTSFLATKQHRWLTGVPQNPNEEQFNLDTTWEVSYKLAGSYRAPYNINVGALYTALTGAPGQRTFLFRNLPQSSTRTVRLEPYGSRRGPARTNLNLRMGRTFAMKGRQQIELSLDVFNVFNSNGAWATTYVSGPTFGNVTSISPPRVARFAAAYTF